MFIGLRNNQRFGMILSDSLCGLFLISLGIGFYLQVNQMIDHRLAISQNQLLKVRQLYERAEIHENKK